MSDYRELFNTSVYRFEQKMNIMEEKDLGICADISSLRTPEYSVCAAESFQGCPYTDTGFTLDVRLNGERVRVSDWQWLPNAMLRKGRALDFEVESLTAVVSEKRAFVMKITFTDTSGKDRVLPLQLAYRGAPRYEKSWEFPVPQAQKSSLETYSATDRMLSCETEDAAFRITSSLAGMRCFHNAYLWENDLTLRANSSVTVYFSVYMGEKTVSLKEAKTFMERPEELIESSFNWLKKETLRIEKNLPKFTSSNKRLTAMYYRSLVSYMLCRWDNPSLCTSPYFSTGSINGGCMCSYLWDYCGGLMLHPLYDTEGNKKTIKAYLKNDLTTSFALTPVTGEKYGPWYQINQEKIINMVYYHILFTGDKAFLFEEVAGKTVLDWMIEQAYVCDNLSKEVELYDYKEGGSQHLELRRDIVYNGIMPDLNARRYMNYMRVYELTKLAGRPDETLPLRAQGIKRELKALWNNKEKWYDFINAGGKRDIRYTVQMFKFLDSPVIDKDEREGLISHLNDEEFLSKFGLHSMSKKDIAYDQDDIDNGGGGICSHFTTQICSQLYSLGYEVLATDIFCRVLWWGERLPYMGDSCAANMIMTREDTPLQGNIHAISGAQTIVYYLFGIMADFKGEIRIKPVKQRPADAIKIENVRLCGKVFSVEVIGDSFTVVCGDCIKHANIGETITI